MASINGPSALLISKCSCSGGLSSSEDLWKLLTAWLPNLGARILASLPPNHYRFCPNIVLHDRVLQGVPPSPTRKKHCITLLQRKGCSLMLPSHRCYLLLPLSLLFFSSYSFYLFFNFFFFLRERAGEGQRARDTQNPEQSPGSRF